MISADLMIDRISSTSSMRTGSKICLYPSTTSIAVSTSSAPHTQKYCALLSCPEYSSVAVSCIEFVLTQSKGRSSPYDLRRQQIHQRENEHPHQIDEVPVQPGHFHILRIVIFRFQKQDDRSHDQPDQQNVNAVMKHVVRRNQQISHQPKHADNR